MRSVALAGAFALALLSNLAEGEDTSATGHGDSTALVELGRRLFYDADLSLNGTMSCATCHEQDHAFADGNATHPGALDDPGRRNVPGLANIGELSVLTWADPRQTSLEMQVDVPMLGTHPVEMAMTGRTDEIARRLGADPCYLTMFKGAFAGEQGALVDYPHVARALAAFQRSLVSRDTPWDKWQAGDESALTPLARTGAARFAQECASCHAGSNFTDERFHRIAQHRSADPGLMEVTGNPLDEGRFRTAPLRNVALTGPYLHDGSVIDLAGAITAHRQAPAYDAKTLEALIAFLKSLDDPVFVTEPRFTLPQEACGKAL